MMLYKIASEIQEDDMFEIPGWKWHEACAGLRIEIRVEEVKIDDQRFVIVHHLDGSNKPATTWFKLHESVMVLNAA